MADFLPLCQVPVGDTARLRSLSLSDGPMRRRLLDLGLIEGTCITCLQRSPSGDPTAYFVRGSVIALRARDAAQIFVEPCR